MAKQRKPQSDEVVVHVNRKGTLTLPVLGTLPPGASIVKAKLVEMMRKQTTREDGTSSIPGTVFTVDEGKPVGTVGRSAGDAVELVKDTFNVDQLRTWYEEDDRASVRKAIDAQITLMSKEPDEDDGEGDGEGDDEVE
jgi:hypothetical protein